MIGYVTLGSNDPAKAAAFFDPLLAELGQGRIYETERLIVWGVAGKPGALALIKPYDGQAASQGNGTMVALAAADRAEVDRVHGKALALGGSDEGAPGERGPAFYGAYFRDPEGNKFCVCRIG